MDYYDVIIWWRDDKADGGPLEGETTYHIKAESFAAAEDRARDYHADSVPSDEMHVQEVVVSNKQD